MMATELGPGIREARRPITVEETGPTRPAPRQQDMAPGEVVAIPGPEGGDPKALRGPHPSGISSLKREMNVEVLLCGECGEWFPHEVVVAPEIPPVRCERCRWANGLPALDEITKAAMIELRWRLNEYRAVRERNTEQEHDAFVDVTHAAWICGPTLLRALESFYGDQVVRGVKDMMEV